MNATQTSSHNATADYLQRLAQLYQSGQTSPLLDRALRKLLDYEAEENRRLLAQLTSDLRMFEEQYHLASATFYHRYLAGQTDDRMDFVEWASLVQMAENTQRRLHILSQPVPA